jgi:mevalonate kinase
LATQLWGHTVVLRDLLPVVGSSTSAHSSQLVKPKEVLLIHTGKKQSTANELATRIPELSLLQELSNSAERFVQSRKWIEEMTEHHRLLESLGVVPAWLSDLKTNWEKRFGIRALKTTGSGGGDALLVWCDVDSQPAFRNELATLGFWEQLASWNAEGLTLEKT